ncbi:HAMP domain-containing sensor histidine kinase [Streptomyces sp. 549]|uniref:HAMP domain-containing sensor histidine kinase n=1 Tax=Streptomyces sp. 549 TaxID=3049076 RepID=UPI0024C2B9E3|nr:HAMP domain-containing sensor histidine kinase [Streptomyces sp. 549]MDK1472164.1 HAMP domain-containing sensor histidine kinase [Streptomyces sp. 549]
MRRALAGVALAVTSMVALSFLIPLALLVQSEARSRAITVAEQRAAALAPVLALTTNPDDVQQAVAGIDAAAHLGVHLPDGRLIGVAHARDRDWKRAARQRRTFSVDTASGWVFVQPVILAKDQVAVVESYVPRADLRRGVTQAWILMSVLALVLVAGSVVVADRLGTRVVRATKDLSLAAHALGTGDLQFRVEPGGPPELSEAGAAFNSMADRIVDLLVKERELVADLSHRLRTPLTALHLESERISTVLRRQEADRLQTAVTQLESELSSIIAATRSPLSVASEQAASAGGGCEAAAVVAARGEFWSVLASQQGRRCTITTTQEPTPVLLPEDDLAAVVDALVGNVFRHTPQGTAFAVEVRRTAHTVVLSVDDAGPGISDPDRALTRGESVDGSTGLGLDIAHRAAGTGQGSIQVLARGPMGGASIQLEFALPPPAPSQRRRKRRERRRRFFA